MRTHLAIHRLLLAFLVVATTATSGLAAAALGPRAGLIGGDEVFVGAQGEFGPVVSTATLVSSVDFGVGDGPPTMANCDLRFYLLPVPDTGIRLYGAAGPSLEFGDESDLGLSLTLGLHIPMKHQRRYNLEYRWGIGDIPDHRIALAIMFGR